MKFKNKLVLIILGIATVLMTVIGATFAWFTATLTNGSVSKTISTATVSNVTMSNILINLTNALPGTYTDAKIISVSATITGNSTVPYTCSIKQTNAALVDLQYKTVSTTGMSASVSNTWTSVPTDETTIFTGTLSASSSSHSGTVQLRVRETGTNQNAQQGLNSIVTITCKVNNDTQYYTNGENSGTREFAYTEGLLNGADPVLAEGLVPVIITQGGSDFVVTKADTTQEWYKYSESEWANAVKLIASPSKTYSAGEAINHSDIESYFVWIPKYRYKIFDMGTYTGLTTLTTKNQEIQIEFGLTNTTDVTSGTKQSCATPMTSGASGNCAVDRWMTHPAFISLDVNGIWVGKFETTGTVSSMTVKPNVTPIVNQTVSTMFTNALAYDTSLESHMMKNTEWGAVAYLAHSTYGMGNNNIYINNYLNGSTYQTGCVGAGTDTAKSTTCTYKWYETNGQKGSTTGNITGIYDISGGVWEYMASYRNNTMGSSGFTTTTIAYYDNKYFDVYDGNSSYSSFNKRILGDATGEMGPFQNVSSNQRSSWYSDYAVFVYSSNPWFLRGSRADSGVAAGLVSFHHYTGEAIGSTGFRLVLAP